MYSSRDGVRRFSLCSPHYFCSDRRQKGPRIIDEEVDQVVINVFRVLYDSLDRKRLAFWGDLLFTFPIFQFFGLCFCGSL